MTLILKQQYKKRIFLAFFESFSSKVCKLCKFKRSLILIGFDLKNAFTTKGQIDKMLMHFNSKNVGHAHRIIAVVAKANKSSQLATAVLTLVFIEIFTIRRSIFKNIQRNEFIGFSWLTKKLNAIIMLNKTKVMFFILMFLSKRMVFHTCTIFLNYLQK